MAQESNSEIWDVIVVGGGAAGLMTAASAIRSGRSVLLIEKNNKLGVKILMSGGTRCNITHACDRADIVKAFGRQGKFLHSSLAALPPDEVVSMIESQGVATKVEAGGKIFPCSDRAIDVRDALVRLATDSSQAGQCQLRTGVSCKGITKSGEVFLVATSRDNYQSKAVVLTTGGKSYPGCGTTGDGYGWAKAFGHSIVNPVAALTPIVNDNCWSRSLKGTTFPRVTTKIEDVANGKSGKRKALDQREGGFLFTHFGYSGPSVLDISRAVAQHSTPENLTLVCDFDPETKQEALAQDISNSMKQRPKQTVLNVLADRFTRRFVESALSELKIAVDQKAGEVSKHQIAAIVDLIKRSRFPVGGTYGFKKAEVTAGGVDLREVDSSTMESKIQPGLFFAGEILDLDGPIGGYNFQSAFSTGWLAGRSC